MIHTEVERVIADLERATTCVWNPETADEVLERVLTKVGKVIDRMRQSQQGKLYRSVYSRSRR